MNPFSLLVKPVGGTCNLNCDYCFYKEHRGGTMSVETMDQLFSSYAALPFPAKAIALQGGEPLLAWDTGIFQRLAAFPVDKSLQTNATLVTEEIAETLKRDNWLVGASLDGPRELNRLRGDSYEAIVAGILLGPVRGEVKRPERPEVDFRCFFRAHNLKIIPYIPPSVDRVCQNCQRHCVASFPSI